MAKAPKDDIDPGVLLRSARRATWNTFQFFDGWKAVFLLLPVAWQWLSGMPKLEWSALTELLSLTTLLSYIALVLAAFVAQWVMAAWYMGTQRLSDNDPEYPRSIMERETFTLTEAAYLLAGVKIQSGEMTGTALVILQDLQARAGEKRLKVTKPFELEITLENMRTTGGVNGRPKAGAHVEITAETLRKLAEKRGVAIPGLTDDVRKVSA
ncbi:hypothetical protein NS365_05640 [Aureimonas ureilytica]|uniref:Uncharacterized protein n=1 Tax=Aureimonas ureilytica TaxID=401562 RepID=A0A175RVB0_9HYPH|nr:hypothetical protein [Aureimonas ureilytica]KTR06914.1 hypothetical protein NS365_05640 [Aureimonas ureilytica]